MTCVDDNTGTEIIVRVLSIRGKQARLAFEAPEHVTIHRNEVWDRISEQEQESDS